jgi:hypothetical protein
MLTLSYHTLTTDYKDFRYDLLLKFEEFRSLPINPLPTERASLNLPPTNVTA